MRAEPRGTVLLVLLLLLGSMVQFIGDGCGGDRPTSVTRDNEAPGANFRVTKAIESGTGGGCGGATAQPPVPIVDEYPAYEASGWHYKGVSVGDPLESSFYQTNFNDSAWPSGPAAFGDAQICLTLSGHIHSPFSSEEMLLRHPFTLAEPAPLFVYLAVDNDARVYVNGTLVGSTVHDGCAELDGFSFSVPQALVQKGANVLAVAAVNRGADAYADVRMSKTGPCGINPTSLDFGTVEIGASKDLAFTITNTTVSTLEGDVSVPCSDYSIVSGGGPFVLAASQNLTVTVRFSPSNGGQQICTVSVGSGFCADVRCTGHAPGPTQWAGNLHFYEVVPAAEIAWMDAFNLATGSSYGGESGYLATVTSADEQAFVASLLPGGSQYWIGGFQAAGASGPSDSWHWDTTEPWSYTNWAVGQPDDNGGPPCAGKESYLTINLSYGMGWNDEDNVGCPCHGQISGYVIEYGGTNGYLGSPLADCYGLALVPEEARARVIRR